MKTPEQIDEWLRSQEWFNHYTFNVVDYYGGIDFAGELISGQFGRNTIILAFPWYKSNEGRNFWSKINRQFLDWYNKEDGK